MSGEAPLLPTSSPAAYGEFSGVGGKLRKPPARKTPSTPYDRPPRSQQHREKSGWLSKIVDPAYRLISGGATRLLPFIFSPSPKSDELSSLPPLEPVDFDEGHLKVTEETLNDNPEVTTNTHADDDGLSKIEQLIKAKNFSRDDINRLMEILQSRSAEFEQQRKDLDLNCEVKVNAIEAFSGKPVEINEYKPEALGRALGSSNPLRTPNIQETIGTTPVAVAKAYMGSRTTDRGLRYEGYGREEMLSSVQKDEGAGFPSVPLPSRPPTPSICWPGAIIQEHSVHHTPDSRGGRSTLCSFPRTPYSRTLFSKSKSKLIPLPGESEKHPSNSSTPFWRAQTPISGQSDASEDLYGSVGPMRRMRNKFITQSHSKMSPQVRSFKESPLQKKDSSDYGGFLSKKIFENGASSIFTFHSSDVKARNSEVVPVHQHHSKLARQILEQISKPPSQKEKLDELKMAVSARKHSSSPEPVSVGPNNQVGLSRFAGISHKNKGKDTAFSKVAIHDDRGHDVTGTAKDGDSTAITLFSDTSACCDGNAATPTTNGFQLKIADEADNKDVGKLVHTASSFGHENKEQCVASKPSAFTGSAMFSMQERPSFLSRAKPDLPSISIDKSSAQSIIASDNNTGFTFPVTNSSSLPPPPTPSVLPSSMAISSQHLADCFTTPTYSFGNKKSRLVFSFPSTSTAATVNDAANIKFKFGSEEERISFGLTWKDAVCC